MAHSFSLSPVHRPDMTEILLKISKIASHAPTHPPTYLISGFPAHTVSRWIVRNSYSENKKSVSLCNCADRFQYLGLICAHGWRTVFMLQRVCILLYTRRLISDSITCPELSQTFFSYVFLRSGTESYIWRQLFITQSLRTLWRR